MASLTIAQAGPFTFESNRRDVSFSSYLSLIRDDFTLEFENSSPQFFRASCCRKKSGDDEIGVFAAEKYFSGEMDNESKLTPEKGRRQLARPCGLRAWSSSCSDSSLKSEPTGHLHVRSKISPPTTKQSHSKGIKKIMGVFRCVCTSRKAVEISGGAADHSPISSNKWNASPCLGSEVRREVGFKLPNLNTAAGKMTAGREFGFGPPLILVKDELGSAHAGRGEEEEDPGCDDTSSDLFEIETALIDSHPLFRPMCYYEPSEASVEWSIVTASAANFSGRSDYCIDDHRCMQEVDEVAKKSTELPLGHKAVDVKTGCDRPRDGIQTVAACAGPMAAW